MVAVIVDSHKDVKNALSYNQRKVDEAQAKGPEYKEADGSRILAVRGLDGDETLEDAFDRLEDLNRKTRRGGRKLENQAFHMSINPGENDEELSDDQLTEIADKIMAELGYGDQPYVIIKHEDIARHHVHVVSSRIGQDGKKINDAYEHTKLMRILQKLGKEYGFKVGLEEDEKKSKKAEESVKEAPNEAINAREGKDIGDDEKGRKKGKKEESKKEKEKRPYVPAFSRTSDVPVTEQMKNIVEDSLQWHFSTPEQYGLLLRYRYRLNYQEYDNAAILIGLKSGNVRCTPPIKESLIHPNLSNDVHRLCDEEKMSARKRQKERLEKEVREALEKAKDYEDFKKKLAERGIMMSVSWSENGKPFGITWIDRATRCIWKASETEMTLNRIMEEGLANGWTIIRDARLETPVISRAEERHAKGKDVRTRTIPAKATETKEREAAETTAGDIQTEEAKNKERTVRPPRTGGGTGQSHRSNKKIGGHDDIWEDEAKKHFGGM